MTLTMITAYDADGRLMKYRRAGSVIERCWAAVGHWSALNPHDYPTMTPAELRTVAKLIESSPSKETP